MRFKTYTLDEAIAKKCAMMNNIGELSWNQREYRTLLMIKAYTEKGAVQSKDRTDSGESRDLK